MVVCFRPHPLSEMASIAPLKKWATSSQTKLEICFALDTRDIADSKVVETVRTVEQLDKDQYQQFVTKEV